ncbi:MAG TPA: peptidase C39 [Trinickia sp.]
MRHLLFSPLPLALALAVCELGSSAHAAELLAATPEFLSASRDIRWQAVGDDVLSHQTGKGAGGTMVSGLVLELLSQWQMPNGASASAHGTLTVTTHIDNSLSTQVTTSAQASDGGLHGNGKANGLGNAGYGNAVTPGIASAGNGSGNGASAATGATGTMSAAAGTGANPQASATGGQNVSVNGVSQITQVAGNGNSGMNSTVIDFNGSSASSASTLAGNAAPNPVQGTGADSSSIAIGGAGTSRPAATATSASGNVKAGISFANGGVSVTLQTPAGVATQTISPSIAQRGGSIAQLLQIAGNGQAVVNQLKLSVQTLPMSSALMRQLGVLQALQNAALGRR